MHDYCWTLPSTSAPQCFFLQQDSFDFAFLYAVDYERGRKCNSMLLGQKLQELKTGLGT